MPTDFSPGSFDDPEYEVTDETGTPIGGGGGGTSATEYTQGSARTGTDKGVPGLAVRKDASGNITGVIDGDYSPLLLDSDGNLKVTGGTNGTEYTQGDVAGTADGPAILAVRHDANTALTGVADGDFTPVQTDANGNVKVNVVSGSATTTEFDAGEAFTAADAGTSSLAVRRDANTPLSGVADGDYTPLQTDATGALKVSGGTTQYAEDAVAVSGDLGTVPLAVRRDTPSASAANGDYNTLNVDANGRLYTSVNDPNVTAAGLGKAEDAPAASGDTGVAVLGVRRDTPASSATTDGDYATINLDASGRVYVTPTDPNTTAAGLGKVEDAAHTTGDVGVSILGVRRDTAASSATTDGDYATLNLDATGRLYTAPVDPNVTAAGLGKAEDAVHASGDVGVMSLAVRRDTAVSSSTTDGDYSSLNVDALGKLYTHTANSVVATTSGSITAAAVVVTAEVFGNAVSVQTIGTFSATLQFEISNDNTNWTAVALQNAADPTVVYVTSTTTTGVTYYGPAPARYFRVRCSAFTSATTASVVINLLAAAPSQTAVSRPGTQAIQGPAPHDAGVSGNGSPLRIAGRSNDGNTTEVSADDDIVDAWYRRSGAAVTGPETTATAPTESSVGSNVSSVALLASNTARRKFLIRNDSARATLYISMGGTAATTSPIALGPGGYETFIDDSSPVYTGAINGIWSAAVGSARITEWTT